MTRVKPTRAKIQASPRKRVLAKTEVKADADQAASVSEPLVELFPYGISVFSAQSRPVLILKDKTGDEVLPVWLSPLDAGLALSDLSQATSPHGVSKRIVETLGLRLERCLFADVVGHHQYVELGFKGNEALENLRLRADEAMSFCLVLGARFYSTKSYMARCRDMDAELLQMEHVLAKEAKTSGKNHGYMM